MKDWNFCFAALFALTPLMLLASDETEPSLSEKIDRISEQNYLNTWQGKSGSASVHGGPFIDIAFLYSIAKIDGLEFVQKTHLNFPDGFPGILKVNGKYEDLDFKWKPGAQVKLGYILPCHDQWDVALTWTYLHSKAHNSVSVQNFNPFSTSSSTVLRPSWTPILLGSIADHAAANWRLNFNTLDLSLGRNFFIGRFLSFHPYLGIRAVWIDQNYKVKYHSAFSYSDETGDSHLLFQNSQLKAHNDFWAVGLLLGTDLKWAFHRNFSLIGKAAGSLVGGDFDLTQKIHGGFIAGSADGPVINPETVVLKQDNNSLRPNLEGQIGLEWQMFFKENKYRIALSTSYFASYWFRQNELLNEIDVRDNLNLGGGNVGTNVYVTPDRREGDLQFQGGMINLSLEF